MEIYWEKFLNYKINYFFKIFSVKYFLQPILVIKQFVIKKKWCKVINLEAIKTTYK